MTLRTKNMLAWCLVSTGIVTALNGLDFIRHGTVVDDGLWPAFRGITCAAAVIYLFFNYFLIRILTGLCLFGGGDDREGKTPVRQFSWLLLLTAPIFLGAPVWLFLTQGVFVNGLVGGAATVGTIFFYLLVPVSDGTLAAWKVKEQFSTPKR